MLPNEQIPLAIRALNENGVILYPTDTVWGLGCRFDSEAGYEKLRQIKQRPENQAFIMLVGSVKQLKEYVSYIHPRIETLLHYHERPLTIVYKRHRNIPKHCLADDGTVAIRVVKDRFCQELTQILGCPITSTSANKKGQPTPAHFGEIQSDILSKADFVFDYKRSKSHKGEPSVIAGFNKKGDLIFFRE